MLRLSPRFGLLLVLALISVHSARAQDHHVAREFDPTITLDIDAGKFRYDVYVGREKSEELEAGDVKFGGGVSFRVKPLFKRFLDALDTDKQHVLVFRIGYEQTRAGEEGERSKTHALRVDGTFRWGFPKEILVANRNRFELRWVDGDPSFRYRNRMQVERPFSIIKRKHTPYASAEAYWDSRFRSWNKFRFSGGMEIPLIWRTSLDLSYTRERCVTCEDPNTDIFGASLTVFLKLKK